MPNTKEFSVETQGSKLTGTLSDKLPVDPNTPPTGLTAIGPRVTFHFITEPWIADNEYRYYDVVNVNDNSYIAIKNVPSGTEITDTEYWFHWADPNAQYQELLNTVQTFDGRITENTESIEENKTELVSVNQKIEEILYHVNASDTVETIQDALDKYTHVVFDQGTYNLAIPDGKSSMFTLRSGTHIEFDGAVIVMQTFTGDYYNVFNAQGIDHFIIDGNGTVIGDGATHIETDPDKHWGYLVNVSGSSDFKIDGLTLQYAFGDGIYVSYATNHTERGIISNCVFDRNVRQGMSIEDCRCMIVENCTFMNTSGTPGAGIDIEPYQSAAIVENLLIQNCRTTGNSKGVLIYNNYCPMNVRIASCKFEDSINLSNKRDDTIIYVVDCTIKTKDSGQYVNMLNTSNKSIISMVDCTYDCTGHSDYIVRIGSDDNDDYQYSSFYRNIVKGARIVNANDMQSFGYLSAYSGQGLQNNYIELQFALKQMTSIAKVKSGIVNSNNSGKVVHKTYKTLSEDSTLSDMFINIVTGGSDFSALVANRISDDIVVFNNTSETININNLASSGAGQSKTVTLDAYMYKKLEFIPYINGYASQ